jgi:hypothetical protein
LGGFWGWCVSRWVECKGSAYDETKESSEEGRRRQKEEAIKEDRHIRLRGCARRNVNEGKEEKESWMIDISDWGICRRREEGRKKKKGVGKLNAIVAWGETVKKGIEW